MFHFWNMTFTWSWLVSTSLHHLSFDFMLVHVNASTPFKKVFQKNISFFPTSCLKMSNFFTFEWPPSAQKRLLSKKTLHGKNATFIESRTSTECKDVFSKSLVWSAKKLIEVKKLFHIWSNGLNCYQNQHTYEKPLQCECFTNTSKFIKAYSMITSISDRINVKINVLSVIS